MLKIIHLNIFEKLRSFPKVRHRACWWKNKTNQNVYMKIWIPMPSCKFLKDSNESVWTKRRSLNS